MTQREDFVRCARRGVGVFQYCSPSIEGHCYDCSGYVRKCWHEATGQHITGSSYEQFTLGKPTRFIVPGTLLFYDTENNGTAGHVAISIGEGKVAHAMNENRDVVISDERANMGGPLIGVRYLAFPDERDAAPAPMEEPPKGKARWRRDLRKRLRKDR